MFAMCLRNYMQLKLKRLFTETLKYSFIHFYYNLKHVLSY
jgi:hypothetical protein